MSRTASWNVTESLAIAQDLPACAESASCLPVRQAAGRQNLILHGLSVPSFKMLKYCW